MHLITPAGPDFARDICRPVPSTWPLVAEDDTYQKTDASWFVRVHFSMVKSHHILLLLGSKPHLRTFYEMFTSKCFPVDSISKSVRWSTRIMSLEIRLMTTFIPPGAFVDQSTGRNKKLSKSLSWTLGGNEVPLWNSKTKGLLFKYRNTSYKHRHTLYM